MQISECSISIQSTSHKCWLRRVLDVAQQGETKDDGKNSQNKQIARIFLFFFPKGTSRNQFIFYFFFSFEVMKMLKKLITYSELREFSTCLTPLNQI